MVQVSTQSRLHQRLSAFVDWIAPDPASEEKIRAQAAEVRERIKGQATTDRLTVRSMPSSGSFAKRTGLRRHHLGKSGVDGQDVDVAFVVSPLTKDDERLRALLDRFEGYAATSYPQTDRTRTKSSIRLSFKGTGLRFDLVPMLAVSGTDDAQILIRDGGDRRRTSIQKHIEFIKRRTDESNALQGRVKFNELVRLLKWWREVRQENSTFEVPSFLLDLLAAAAYDRESVERTYAATLAKWFAFLAHVVRTRATIAFSDFTTTPAKPAGVAWAVFDPVSSENNVVAEWASRQIDELAEWCEAARDHWARVIRMEQQGQDSECLAELTELFGPAFPNHCGEKP